jgi:hypothetical protein
MKPSLTTDRQTWYSFLTTAYQYFSIRSVIYRGMSINIKDQLSGDIYTN